MNTRTLFHFWNAGRGLRALFFLVALITGLGYSHASQAQTVNSSITASTVVINNGSGNQVYVARGGNATNNSFQGANLGTYDISNFNIALILNGGSLTVQEVAPEVVDEEGTILTYSIRRANPPTTPGGPTTFTNVRTGIVALPQTSTSADLPNRVYSNVVANQNLLAGLTAGSYRLNISYRASGQDADGNEFFLFDPQNSSYQATFTVTGVRPSEPPTSTTWTGGKDDNWFDPANWTQGVPDATKDATIPDFASRSTVQYPNIYSNTTKPQTTTTTTVQNPDGTFSTVTTVVPGYDNTNSGPALARNLIMQGVDQFQRSIVRLVVGNLRIFGNFVNPADSFIQRENTVITFAGTDQTITGSVSGFVGVEIDGGGTKSLINNFSIQTGGYLRFINGILTTRRGDSTNPNDDATSNSFVELSPAATSSGRFIPSGRIEGETETSYLRGFVKTSQPVVLGSAQDFGNIGLTMTFVGNDPGVVTVTRTTLGNFSTVANGANDKPSIRRTFGVRPADGQTNTGGLNATLVFGYLDNETRNLQPNNQALNESNLALFLSSNGGNIFGQIGRDALNTQTNQLTKAGVRAFGTFTLSEATAPLPVTLTAFDARRAGNDAVVTWETVAEENSKGYEVQVSTDGRTFRTLGFIASASPNSNRLQSYRFVDTEANKAGTRYYRLRQIDLDGKDSFYGPKVLNFNGIASTATELKGFPNPFDGELTLTTATPIAGPAQLTVLDMTGRVVTQQQITLSKGTNDIAVSNPGNLRSGVYMMRVVLPTGEVQTLRISKR